MVFAAPLPRAEDNDRKHDIWPQQPAKKIKKLKKNNEINNNK